MIAALIDNGSLEPAAHRNLRGLAETLSLRTGINVEAVSWKHSDRIHAASLGDTPAWTLAPWLRARHEAGEREFAFVPFFISAQGAIGSALRHDIDALAAELGEFRFAFSAGLHAQGVLPRIVADRIRACIARRALARPAVIVVDHGGPSPTSAQVRNQIATEVRRLLGAEIKSLIAASMEGAEHAHNQPLFADALATEGFDAGDVVVAPLFLAPGRHAGPRGDLAEIAIAAEDRLTAAPLRCHFADLVGTHPDVAPALADALAASVSTFHVAA